MSEIIDKFYTPLLTVMDLSAIQTISSMVIWGYVGNFLPKLEKALTGLWTERPL